MLLQINPHAAGATLCAQRDSTLSKDSNGEFIACLPFFNSNLPEYLPSDVADQFGQIFEATSAPLVDIRPDLMHVPQPSAANLTNARLEKLLLCNRPKRYSSANIPSMGGIGEPALQRKGKYVMVPNGAVAYKVNAVFLQQELLCSGRMFTRFGGEGQGSKDGKRQNKEGPITSAIVAGHKARLAMVGHAVTSAHLSLADPVGQGMAYRTDIQNTWPKSHDICFGGTWDSKGLEDEPSGITVDSTNEWKLWNQEAPMVLPVIKRGRFKSQYTFYANKAERDVDRVDQEGCGDWSDHELYNLLKDYFDQYGFERSYITGNVVPASATTPDSDSSDTPLQSLKHAAHASTPVILDAIARVLCSECITQAIAHSKSDDGEELRRLWLSDPSVRLDDDDQQKLKLMLLALPSTLPGYAACASISGFSEFGVAIDGGGQLSESSSAAAPCTVVVQLRDNVRATRFMDYGSGMAAGLEVENSERASLLNQLTTTPVNAGAVVRSRPMFGNATTEGSWIGTSHGLLYPPQSLLSDESFHRGNGNMIANDYSIATWSGVVAHALSAMGSCFVIEQTFAADQPPLFMAGDTLGVFSPGVSGCFENIASAYTCGWDESTLKEESLTFFFTNGGQP